MKKLLLITILLFACLPFVKAQEEEEQQEEKKWERMAPKSTFIPRTIVKDKDPINYMPVREADIIWSKVVWRRIDCRERMNFPLYFPTTDLEDQKSLSQALLDGLRSGAVQAYSDEEMKNMMTLEEVLSRFDASDKVETREKIDGSGDTTIVIKGAINWEEVREFDIKEEWYFDRHYSQLFVRIVGICPVRVYRKEMSFSGEESVQDIEAEEMKTRLFWVYFPEARRVLANTICYVGGNDLAQISYDDVFHKRRFQSYIYAESNTLNNRTIKEYARNGVEEMMEAERIKWEILNYESDLWEY